ncbi:flavin reductase family protein [Aestuariivirga litoralis]|uniref:flavin reductase family protein n=1 Tax=Aestuariivirga litoralis TaxID=2650924 RepID=UPI0018C5E62F|nr:flavin reductase family protein [Aestuariivirga litoralis]MBG1233856.1 flavin reductase family protein [Aestuariivirga litoralis]
MTARARIDSPPPVSEATGAEFREAMRQLAGGVSVVTTGRGRLRTGLTATSVTSLSAEPPSLLVCINKSSSALLTLRETKTFAVNILSAGQQDIADRFAGRSGVFGAARYAGADWDSLATGTPVLEGALANLDCRVENISEWNSHAIVIGRVVAIKTPGGNSPLVYWRGNYAGI